MDRPPSFGAQGSLSSLRERGKRGNGGDYEAKSDLHGGGSRATHDGAPSRSRCHAGPPGSTILEERGPDERADECPNDAPDNRDRNADDSADQTADQRSPARPTRSPVAF